MKSTLDLLKEAHYKSGAPGTVVGFYGDGRYKVKLQYGERTFRFRTHPGINRVTIYASWSIDGDRQRKQATA